MNNYHSFFKLLARFGIASKTVEHEAVFTAAELGGRDLSQWEFPVKNILLEDKDKQLYLVTMHLLTGPLDLKELAKRLSASGRFSFASPERLAEVLKVTPGSVTPFAIVNDKDRRVRLVLDSRLRDAKSISAHPLVNTMTTTLAMSDFAKLLDLTGHSPVWCDLPLKAKTRS